MPSRKPKSSRKKAPRPVIRRTQDWAHLKKELDAFLHTVDWDTERDNDPVSFVWAYDNPEDQEVVALIAATMAYGRVSLLKKAIATVLAPLGESPAQTLRQGLTPELMGAFDGFVYRMTQGDDVVALLRAISTALQKHGSLGALFAAGVEDDDKDYQSALGKFVHTLREYADSDRRGLRYLLSDPTSGSACKRLCLFMRWVVRGPDKIDLGLWDGLDPAKLVMPLDTHIVRISSYLGLTTRKSPDWKMAGEVTRALAKLSPEDPLRYDFALCHLGISGSCPSKKDPVCCNQCPIEAVCLL